MVTLNAPKSTEGGSQASNGNARGMQPAAAAVAVPAGESLELVSFSAGKRTEVPILKGHVEPGPNVRIITAAELSKALAE